MAADRILIVEDDVATEGEPLAMRVKRAGYAVVGIAETEEQAVEMAVRKKPRVVLMDIELEDQNGNKDRFAGLRAARRIRQDTGAQVIFLSGILGETDVIAEARELSDFEFLMKPVRQAQLLLSIQMAIARATRKNMVFVCYSHEDKRFADEMTTHLSAIEGLGTTHWVDTQIAPSRRWKEEINKALASAKAAVCLVSSSFVSSKFIAEVELPALLTAERERGLKVFPVFVNYVDEKILKRVGLSEFRGINDLDDPIASWPVPKRHQYCWGELCKWLHRELTNRPHGKSAGID